LNVEDTPPKVRVLGLGKAKHGGKLKFKIELTDDSDTVGYGVSIKDWGFSDSGTIKLENGRGEKEFEVVVPAGAKSADLEVEAKDTGGNEDRVVMKVEVVEKNRAPEIIRIDVEGEVWIGGRFIASAVAYDPEGDEMSYEWVLMKGEKDYSGWMMVYGATAVVDVPENASGGIYLMKVKVKDSEGGERIFVREIKLTKEVKEGESVCVPSEEICDGLDNDCNGLIDDGVKLVFYKDLDRDGYTDGTTSVGCSAPQGYVLSTLLGDCNDEDNQINPGKTEICDGIDNNCNGLIDEGVKLVFYKDLDGDGYTDGTTQVGCSAPSGYVLSATSGDCNDNDPNINPARAEICDGKDNNCNGQIDEGFNVGQSCTVGVGECARTGQYVCNADSSGTQCNATPGTPTAEICDGKDNNCNGQIDEGNVCAVARAKVVAGATATCAIKQDGSLWCWGNSVSTPVQIMSSGVVSVALGDYHACAIKTDGSLWCWGNNWYGQLGDGTNTGRNTPVQIMSSGVSSVALLGNRTCAIKTDGSLWCWGDNSFGQLGDGTNTHRNTPVQIMSSGVVSVALGGKHTCAIKQDGSLWCWGGLESASTPTQIMSSGVSSVALGGAHTCAVKTDGSLWCWGDNSFGQIGIGTYEDIISVPVQVMTGVVSVFSSASNASYTCVIKQDSSLWCWGANFNGQIGNGTYGNIISTPIQIMSSGVSSVALSNIYQWDGYGNTCAVKYDGSLWCWGANDYGQVGIGTYENIISTPVQVISSGVLEVSLGWWHTCAMKRDGSLWCWGHNYYGQVGDGTGGDKKNPVQIMSSGVSSVALGGEHTCAIKQDGSLWCWGGLESASTPTQIMSSEVSAIALGDYHTCAIKTDGSLWCWGRNDYGQLGDGTNTNKNTPVQIMSSEVSSVALGGNHTCAVKIDGSLWCWGDNSWGQVGLYPGSTNAPVLVIWSEVSAIALGDYHTCAIKTDGSLWCWGLNQYGQLGDGTNTSKNTPVQIMSSGVSSVAAGGSNTCVVKQDSSLWCWGNNSAGQVGNGTYGNSISTPTQVMSSGVKAVSVGGGHTCAVKIDGSLWCWGDNWVGQLGNGTYGNIISTPVQVMSSGVSSVALGSNHTCAIKTDGSLWCWGDNRNGQVGDGSAWRTTPVYIMNLGSGGGGAPPIGDKSSFDNREEIRASMEQKQTRYGCSSANIVFYVLHLIFPAFILFALLKRKLVC
jgi:alpha-tubulin suppressor-like RCC1 family protein